MSQSALRNYKEAREQRLGANDARRIRAERDKARSPTSGASRRWPFELLQNAHDPGPKDGASQVDLRVHVAESALLFQHNGRPFTLDDLAALLSGGSNKDYDSSETTGRFGTGFLVTHVLSPKITLRGVLLAGTQYERFEINLDRSGDEQAILENTKAAEECIQHAGPIEESSLQWTAEFEYPINGTDGIDVGIDAVRLAAPFLFGTCEHLGCVTIGRRNGPSETWNPQLLTEYQRNDVTVRDRPLTLVSNGSSTSYRVLQLIPINGENVVLLIVVRTNGDRWKLERMSALAPRVFSRFPIRGSTFLPINCVIDGRFDVQEERDRIAMTDDDKAKIEAALRLIPTAIQIGLSEGWEDCHWLARVSKLDTAFSETARDEELRWWNHQLDRVAAQLVKLPLVNTTKGFLPTVLDGEEWSPDFVIPRYSKSISKDELSPDRVWRVAAETKVLAPPVQELVSDWNELSAGWESLGTRVERCGLKEIAEQIRGEARTLRNLPVTIEPRAWLAQYLELIGELPGHHDCTILVQGLLPNQNEDLCSPVDLKRDYGIPDELKDIAELICNEVRSRLLDQRLGATGPAATIAKLIPAVLTEEEVLDECLEHLAKKLPNESDVAEDLLTTVNGSIGLLKYIWATRGRDGADLAHRCPLLTQNGSIARLSTKNKIMAPIAVWPEKARRFADIYAPERVLADKYCEDSTESCDLVRALVEWGIAFSEPLVRDTRAEVKDKLLQHLTDEDVHGLVVRDEVFSQVALLGTEIIQRCEPDEARPPLLLGFVLAYVAPRDASWRATRTVVATREGNDVPLELCDALWLAELKSRAWVPIQGEAGSQTALPTPANLAPLLGQCKEHLINNDAAIDFLIKCFRFDVLDLRLEALPKDVKEIVSERLAALVQMGGANTAFYQEVVENLELQQRREAEKERNRKFGLAVQQAIQVYLTGQGLSVSVIDRGYDLDVEVPENMQLMEAGTHSLLVGPFRVEVKATTTGEVRLTPAQAQVASIDRNFVLCVVDLRGCDAARLAEPWTVADIEPVSCIVTGLRQAVSETHGLVEAATEKEIAIRNQGKLRYGVPTTIWEAGKPIRSWVAEIRPRLQ